MKMQTAVHKGNSRVARVAPGPRGHFLLGNLPDYRRDPIQFYMTVWRAYGDVVRLRSGPWHWYLISHPEDIQHVLRDNYPNYRKSFANEYLKTVLGLGLLTNEGESWLRQRRLMQPAFHRKHVVSFSTMMTETTMSMLQRWHGQAGTGEPLDIAAEMMRLTYEVVGRTLFSIDLSDKSDAVAKALTVALEHVNFRVTHLFSPPEYIPTPHNLRFKSALRVLDDIVYGMIEERRRSEADPGDLLSLLLNARDAETGRGMSDKQLRDEVMTIMLAGHETTAVALSWTWYLLSKHPAVARKLHAELSEVLGRRPPTVEDLPNLKYTKMVIEESMRLFPPAWVIARSTIEEDEIGGYHIPANTPVVISPYVTHRRPDLWENPEGFDPERFSPDRLAGRPHFAYFPFGGGPRQCIGNDFAMMEARLILATVAQQFDLHLVPGQRIEPEPMVTLRPRHGILMTLHERDASARTT